MRVPASSSASRVSLAAADFVLLTGLAMGATVAFGIVHSTYYTVRRAIRRNWSGGVAKRVPRLVIGSVSGMSVMDGMSGDAAVAPAQHRLRSRSPWEAG
jgi:hypothetical protein